MTQASDREAAFHEAGHAALHVWLAMPLRWASIVPDDEAGTEGAVAGYPPPKYVRDWFDEGGLSIYGVIPPRVRDWLEREMMILLAGEVAQEKATGTTEGSALEWDHPEHGVVVVDGDWHRIIGLADDMSLGDRERTAYVDWLHARTIALLDLEEVWAMVDDIASALLECRRLTGRRVREVARAAHRRILDRQMSESRSVFAKGEKHA